VAEIQLGKMLQPVAFSPQDQLVPYLRAGSLAQFDLLNGDALPEMYASPSDLQQFSVSTGDLVVAEGGDCGQTAFVPALERRTIIQNSLHRVRGRVGDQRFISYCLESIHGSGWLDVLCNKSTFGHLTREKLATLRIPFPDLPDQSSIADYLDRETERIDGLVAAKRELVRLLDERLRLLAYELTAIRAVAVPLRRLVAAVKTGTTPPVGELARLSNGAVPWYSPGDVSDWLELATPARTLQAEAVTEGWVPRFPAQSTLLVGIGATAGKVAFLDHPATGNQRMTCLTPGPKVIPRFLCWQLFARRAEMVATAPFTTLPIINNDFIRSLSMALPSLDEQRHVADRLDSEGESVRALTDCAERQISLLLKRRQSTIARAVTGQLGSTKAV
jgi:type I restriction enzyme S subunit